MTPVQILIRLGDGQSNHYCHHTSVTFCTSNALADEVYTIRMHLNYVMYGALRCAVKVGSFFCFFSSSSSPYADSPAAGREEAQGWQGGGEGAEMHRGLL
jgi:hypothetical protein